jgi:hypothetical protein
MRLCRFDPNRSGTHLADLHRLRACGRECNHFRWIATAKRDSNGEFWSAKAEREASVMAEPAEACGVEITDG